MSLFDTQVTNSRDRDERQEVEEKEHAGGDGQEDNLRRKSSSPNSDEEEVSLRRKSSSSPASLPQRIRLSVWLNMPLPARVEFLHSFFLHEVTCEAGVRVARTSTTSRILPV